MWNGWSSKDILLFLWELLGVSLPILTLALFDDATQLGDLLRLLALQSLQIAIKVGVEDEHILVCHLGKWIVWINQGAHQLCMLLLVVLRPCGFQCLTCPSGNFCDHVFRYQAGYLSKSCDTEWLALWQRRRWWSCCCCYLYSGILKGASLI